MLSGDLELSQPRAALVGWPSVDAYYEGSSSSLSLPHIRLPLLCVQVRGPAPEHLHTAPSQRSHAGLAAASVTASSHESSVPASSSQGKCRLKAAHWRVQAGDDPIAPYEGIPFEALEANEHCILSGDGVAAHYSQPGLKCASTGVM